MREIKFRVEKIENKALVIKVSFGSFTDEDSSSTCFSIPDNHEILISTLEIALNSLFNYKSTEIVDRKITYSDSFIERYLKNERI